MSGIARQWRFSRTGESGRLEKLLGAMGTDNPDQRELARAAIDSLLREFGKQWRDIGGLLLEKPPEINPKLVADIAALGSADINKRAKAWQSISDLLARHRQTWSALVYALLTNPAPSWARNPATNPTLDPKDLLPLLVSLIRDYVELKPHEYTVVALWILHTHVFDRFMVTPRLSLRSPVPGCGKTTLFDVISRLVNRPEKYDWITTAALYRLIDEERPTVMLDEADNLGLDLRRTSRLGAVFNSGHRKGGKGSLRERGENRKFSTFTPLALALPNMYGGLSRTLIDRCLNISMEKHDGKRVLKRFDSTIPDGALDAAYQMILSWRQDVRLNPDPEMPIRNRWADNWRVLVSIADSFGWSEQARDAMTAFAIDYQSGDIKIKLLTDIRIVFDAKLVDRLPTKTILAALHELEDSNWGEFNGARNDQHPHHLRDTEFAAMLREFRIRPRTIWPLNRTANSRSQMGYMRSQFEQAWQRYCDEANTPTQSSNTSNLRTDGGRST